MSENLGTTRYSRDTYNVVMLSEKNLNCKISTSPNLDFLRSKEKFDNHFLTLQFLEFVKNKERRFCHKLFGLNSCPELKLRCSFELQFC